MGDFLGFLIWASEVCWRGNKHGPPHFPYMEGTVEGVGILDGGNGSGLKGRGISREKSITGSFEWKQL